MSTRQRTLFILVLCLSLSFLGCEKKPTSPEGPLETLRKAADGGDAAAQYKLGLMYDNGEGVAADSTEAVKWYRKAAEQGHANAQWQLGYKYEHGSGVALDDAESIKWFRKASERGHAIAQFELAMRYTTGKGVVKDSIEAYKWTLLAQMNGIDVTAYKDLLEKEMTPEQIAKAQKQADAFVTEMAKKQKE